MDWSTFVRSMHIIGTALGVGSATLLEVLSIKFSKDGKVDIFEHDVLRICINVLRAGLIIVVFSGFGIMVLGRLRMLGPEAYFSPRFLAKMTVILVLLLVAFLMNFRLINLKVGSAISTASWYAALVFGLWRTNKFSFFVLMGLYLGLIFVTYYILEFFRSRAIKTK